MRTALDVKKKKKNFDEDHVSFLIFSDTRTEPKLWYYYIDEQRPIKNLYDHHISLRRAGQGEVTPIILGLDDGLSVGAKQPGAIPSLAH